MDEEQSDSAGPGALVGLWQAATDNLQFLWGILEDLSKPAASRTPAQQKIGDYFGSCMDLGAIEKRGPEPIRPVLKQIAEMKSKAEFGRWLAKQHVEGGFGGLLFGFGSNQDYGNATEVIAFAVGGGLGLPDRDYYLKTDPKSVEQRQKYVEHVARMLVLPGEPGASQGRCRDRDAHGKRTCDRNALAGRKRDPYKLYHKMTPAN